MRTAANEGQPRRFRWLQTTLSSALALTVGGSFAGTLAFAMDERAVSESHAAQVSRWKETSSIYAYRGGWTTTARYLFLEDIPSVDHERGGVFFFGASNLVSGLHVWLLEPPERSRIHNYGIAGISFSQQLQFLRFLERYEGLFRSPPGRTAVVLCLSPVGAVRQQYFPALFDHGILRYDEEDGLHPASMPSFERRLRVWRMRSADFFELARYRLGVTWRRLRDAEGGANPPPSRLEDREALGREWSALMEPRWRVEMPEELAALERTVRYLEERGARVQAVLMPMPSWQRDLPHVAPFPSPDPQWSPLGSWGSSAAGSG